jgi:hypothetical protein
MEQTKTSSFQYALKWGFLVGLLKVVLTTISYLTGQYSNTYWGLIILPIMFIIHFYLVKSYKDKQMEGYITFGNAFSVCMQIFVFSAVIASLYDIIYLQFISPATNEMILKLAEQKINEKGTLTDDQMEMAMKVARVMNSPIVKFFTSLLFSCIFGAIISAIIAAICKKEKPIVFNQQ